MTNAKKDENSISAMVGISNTDGVTVVPISINATNYGLSADDDVTGTDQGNNNGVAMLDENSTPVLMALSSDLDGTLVEVYVGSANNKLLINSN